MRGRRACCALFLAIVGSSRLAEAQESLDDLGKATGVASASQKSQAPSVSVTGYLSNRLTGSWVDPKTPIATRDVPSIQEMVEGNIQLRVGLGSPNHFAYADVSMVYQKGFLFYEDNGRGGRKAVSDHDVPSIRPFIVPSEVYVSSSPLPWLNFLVGKKRVQWGSGFAYSPMDLINPPKDPTDPNAQRAGNWLARIELPFEHMTVSALFAPQALDTFQGIPTAFVRYPSVALPGGTESRDNFSHYLVATRLYALVADSDVNLVFYASNRYQDAFANKSRVGLSFSRYFFTDYELHVESLWSTGSAKNFPNHACAASTVSCDGAAAFSQAKLGDGTLLPRVLVGTRRQFKDDSLLSVEYYFQGDGYSSQEFSDAVTLLAPQKAMNMASSGLPEAGPSAAGLPQRFFFEPLRRHYIIASYSKPRLFDDWTVGAVVIAGLEDLSGLFSPQVSWSATEWLTLSVYGQVPLRGVGLGEAKVGNTRISEYALLPFDSRVQLEARAFY